MPGSLLCMRDTKNREMRVYIAGQLFLPEKRRVIFTPSYKEMLLRKREQNVLGSCLLEYKQPRKALGVGLGKPLSEYLHGPMSHSPLIDNTYLQGGKSLIPPLRYIVYSLIF